MSKNTYSDQVNNSYLYTNKLFYGEEGMDEKQFTNLGSQILRVEENNQQIQNEIKAANAEIEQLKEAQENMEAEFKEKVAKVENEAEKAKDGLMQCKKDVEKMKEDAGQVINQAKYDDIKAEAEQAKLEAKEARMEALKCEITKDKEEVMQCKIEKVKEELMQCKIDMARAETEWYKKVAEECKKEKRTCADEEDGMGINKPVTNGEDGTGTNKPVTNEGGNENGEIISREITSNLSQTVLCGQYANLYKSDNKIGSQGFNTSDFLKELYPKMFSNPKIAPYIERGAEGGYGGVNFKFTFTEILNSIPNFSNAKCDKCVSNPQELACQDEKVKSFCGSSLNYSNKESNKNFFSRESCPDLFRESNEMSVVKAKQLAPLILVNNLGQMIDKEGDNTQMAYDLLKPYLKINGKIKDCGNDQKCRDYIPVMEKVAWDSGDKEVLLKIVFDNVQKTNPYYYDNEDSSVSLTDII